ADIILVENLGNGAHFPRVRALHDRAQEQICALLAIKLRINGYMNGTPIPPLRDNACPTYTKVRAARGFWEEHPKLGGNAWPRLVLQGSGSQYVFQKGSGVHEIGWLRR